MGADSRRPVSGGVRYGRAQVKRRAGIGSLQCVGALVGKDWMEKAAAAEFNTGGRSSRAATVSFDWGRTGACGFDWAQELAHTCEGEANRKDQGTSPTARKHGQRQWCGGRRFNTMAQAARAREARKLGVK
jgi:hypothetical protein